MSSGSSSSGTSPLPLEIDVRSTASKLAAASKPNSAEKFLLLDCREADEFNRVHIKGAVLLPMSALAERAAELGSHRNDEIVVHCHHGGRSLKVTRWLREHGFQKVQSMAGGIDAWSLEIDSSLPRY